MTCQTRHNAATPCCGSIAAVGMFDGLHTGHTHLLNSLKAKGEEHGLHPVVITFSNHPLEIIAPEKAPRLLSTPEEKAALFHAAGMEAHIIPFDNTLRMTSATGFLHMLSQRYGVREMLLGFNNRFGHDAPHDFDDYRRLASECGITVTQATELNRGDGTHVSSSVIRDLIGHHGNMTAATLLLGYPYELSGTVISGKQLGRTIGFPTANLLPSDSRKLIPKTGVYAATATIPNGEQHPAVVNIGHRPTVDNPGSTISIEAHILGFTGNLYGHTVTLQFRRRLRDERRFPTLDALRTQIAADIRETQSL